MIMLTMLVRCMLFIVMLWSHVGVPTFVGGAGDYIRG